MQISSTEQARYLEQAIEALPEAVAVFDEDGRFVFWNARFAAIYGEEVEIRAGTRFEEHLKRSVAAGLVPAARGCEEAWLAERLGRFASGAGVHVHQLGNGCWVRVQDRAMPNGGRVGIRTEITDFVQREQSFRLLFDANPTPMLVIDRDTLDLLDVNAAAVAFYGYERDALLALKLPDLRPEAWPGEIAERMARLEQAPLQGVRAVHRIAGGAQRIVKVNACLLPYAGRSAVLAAIFDVTEQERMEAEVRDTHAFLQEIIDSVPTAVFVKDMENAGRYVIYNKAAQAMFGIATGGALGRTAADVVDAHYAAQVVEQDAAAMRLGAFAAPYDQVVRHPDGRTRLVRTRKVALKHGGGSRPRFLAGVVEDVTEQRASAARIAHMAHHDLLTDLPNRVLFQERLDGALAELVQGETGLALLYFDLDGFKAVNDAWGHAAGDALLQAVASRIRTLIRAGDIAARLGGDEFALLHVPLRRPRDAEHLAKRLVATLSAPFTIEGRDLRVGASVGIALAPLHGTDARALLARADAAMYRAKREGRGQFRLAA